MQLRPVMLRKMLAGVRNIGRRRLRSTVAARVEIRTGVAVAVAAGLRLSLGADLDPLLHLELEGRSLE